MRSENFELVIFPASHSLPPVISLFSVYVIAMMHCLCIIAGDYSSRSASFPSVQMAHPFPTLSLINRAVITLGPMVLDIEYVGSSAVGGRDDEDGRSVASSSTGGSLLLTGNCWVWRWER